MKTSRSIAATLILGAMLISSKASAQEPAVVFTTLRYTRPVSDLTSQNATINENKSPGLGILMDLTTGRAVFRFRYQHDFASVFSLVLRGLDVDSGEFARDRWEGTAGYVASPYIDIDAGFRNERINFDQAAFDGQNPIGSLDAEFLALVTGVTIHTPNDRPVRGELSLRGYYGGSGWYDGRRSDTRGYRLEATMPIRVGGAVHLVPGFSFDRIRTGPGALRVDARSYFVGVAVSGRSGEREP